MKTLLLTDNKFPDNNGAKLKKNLEECNDKTTLQKISRHWFLILINLCQEVDNIIKKFPYGETTCADQIIMRMKSLLLTDNKFSR